METVGAGGAGGVVGVGRAEVLPPLLPFLLLGLKLPRLPWGEGAGWEGSRWEGETWEGARWEGAREW